MTNDQTNRQTDSAFAFSFGHPRAKKPTASWDSPWPPPPPPAALPIDPATGDSAAHSSPCTFSLAPPAELRFELSSEDSVSTFFGCFCFRSWWLWAAGRLTVDVYEQNTQLTILAPWPEALPLQLRGPNYGNGDTNTFSKRMFEQFTEYLTGWQICQVPLSSEGWKLFSFRGPRPLTPWSGALPLDPTFRPQTPATTPTPTANPLASPLK